MLTKSKQYLISLFFIFPALLIFSVLFLYPLFRGFLFSFTDWNGLGNSYNFIGIDNFKEFFADENALDALVRTLWFALLIVVIQNVLALFLANVLDGKVKGGLFFKAVFFIPAILSPVVVGYLWSFIFDPQGGVLASLFKALHMPGAASVNWLGDDKLALYSVIFVLIWQYFGYSMVIYLSGLQSISPTFYEAGEIDGASAWEKFWHIKFPLIAPSFTISMILSVIGALKLFDHIYVLTRGGPGRATETLTVLIYREAFGIGRMGYGAAVSILLFVFVLLILLVQLKVLQSRELVG